MNDLKKQGFIKGSLILGLTVIFTKALGLFYRIPLANILGGTGMGYYSSAFSVFMPIFALVVSGIPAAVATCVAKNLAVEKYKNVRKIKRISLIGFSFIGLIFSFVLCVLSFFISKHFLHDQNIAYSIIAVSPSIFVASIMSVYRGYYEGLSNMFPTCISESIESVFKIVFGLGFAQFAINIAYDGYAKNGYVFGHYVTSSADIIKTAIPYISAFSLLGITLSTALATIFIFIRSKVATDGISKSMICKDETTDRFRHIYKTVLLLAIPISLSSVITSFISLIDLATIPTILKRLINSNDGFLINQLWYLKNSNIDASEIPNFLFGSYTGLALTVFGLVPSLTAVFCKSALPNVTTYFTRRDKKNLNKNVNAVLFSSTVFAIPATFIVFIFSKPILKLLFSKRILEIEASYKPLSFLALGIIFISLTLTIFSLLQAINYPRLPLKILIFGIIIKIVFNIALIFIPSLNVNGASISTVLCYAFTSIYGFIKFLSLSKIKIDIKFVVFKPLFSSIIMSICCYFIFDNLILQLNNTLSLLITAFFGLIIYILCLYLLYIFNKNLGKDWFIWNIWKKCLLFCPIWVIIS